MTNYLKFSNLCYDARGTKIIADYATAHPPAAKNFFVKEIWTQVEKIKKEIDRILIVVK
jgi:hypothetical protein